MFLMKCFTYVYARYVLSQLYTILIIPRDFGAEQNFQEQQFQHAFLQ